MSKFHADKVSSLALKGVSRQLGGWLDEMTVAKFQEASPESSPPPPFVSVNEMALTGGPLSAQPRWPPFELGETFAVFTLNLGGIEEGLRTGADLFHLAEETSRWHHQVAYNGQPAGFARSSSEDSAGMDVRQLYLSDLARHIDKAIYWLDEFEVKNPDYAASDSLVRLLFIPSYQTHAFWIIKNMSEGLFRRLMSWALGRMGINRAQPQVTSDVLIIDAPAYLSSLRPLTMLTSQQLLEALSGKPPLGGGLTFNSLTPVQ